MEHGSISDGLPEPGPFKLGDLRWFAEPKPDSATPSVLIFDGDCGFCTTAAGWAKRSFRHGERAEAWQILGESFLHEHGLSLRDVQEAAWWLTDDGRRVRGHRAVGRALEAGGGLRRIAGWIVLTPPTSWFATLVYPLAVRWRYRLPGGTPACKVNLTAPKT